MKIAVIGSGLSGTIVLDTLNKKKFLIYLIDSSDVKKTEKIKYDKNLNKYSPKFNNSFFKKKK